MSRHQLRRKPLAFGIAGVAALVAALAAWLTAAPADAAVGAGTYTLVNAGSGLCLDLPGSSTAAGVQFDQASCNGGSNQKWTLTSVSGGFTIKSVSSGLCAGVRGAATDAGKAIEQESCTGASSQTWTLTASGSDYRVANANGGKCMNTAGNSTAAGALVQTNSCDSVATKQWTFNTSGATPPPTTSGPTPTRTTASPTPTRTVSPTPTGSSGGGGTTGLIGYAAISGDGHGPTTGGAGGPTVTVTSLSALETEAAKGTPEIIRVSGLLSGSGEVSVASNKTIVGVGASSGLTGIGLKMNGVFNVIVQNMNISFVTAASGDGDAIHIESSDHIWIDHNNLFSDMSHDKDFYDGLVDITHAGDFVTVSWNFMHDHWKVSLVGHSDSNGSEDTGHLKVTYHHNWWQNFNSRTPSLRFGVGHVFDNYFVNGDTAVHSRENAQMLVQNNVFRGVSTPIETTGDSPVDGFVNQSGNDFGGGTNNITQTGSFTNPPYSYSLDPTSSVISIVTAGAGTGKI